jgi:hypothetical protein
MAEKSSISVSARSPIRNATLLGLPLELHFHIFKHLDNVTATCLGLTSKHLYGSFKDAYGHMIPIRLSEQIEVRDEVTTGYFWLSDLLETWMLPYIFGWQVDVYKFVSWERYCELEVEMERRRRDYSVDL